jgi:hypothetical protein
LTPRADFFFTAVSLHINVMAGPVAFLSRDDVRAQRERKQTNQPPLLACYIPRRNYYRRKDETDCFRWIHRQFILLSCSLKSSSGPGATTAAPAGPTPRLAGGQGGGPDGQGVMLGDSSWLASLATGAAPPGPALRASPLAPLLLGVGGLLLVL